MNTDRLVILLSRLRRFLEKHEDPYWLSTIVELLDQLAAHTDVLRAKIRDLYGHGGMGSWSDFAITKRNGHRVERENEANFELQALFEALYREAKPPENPKGPIKHFIKYPSTNAEWEVELTSGNLESIFDVLIWITYHHPDWRWVQEWCLYFTHHSNQDVRALAARCLADLARLHKSLDAGKVLTRLGELMSDPEVEVREQAEEALRDINSVLSVVS